MVTQTAPIALASDSQRVFNEWIQNVRQLCRDVHTWSEEQGWQVVEGQIEIREEPFGIYTLPELTLTLPEGKVLLKPVGRQIYGAEGRVDLYSYPAWDEVHLMRVQGKWVPRIALGLTWPIEWSQACFVDLVQRLIAEP